MFLGIVKNAVGPRLNLMNPKGGATIPGVPTPKGIGLGGKLLGGLGLFQIGGGVLGSIKQDILKSKPI